MKRLLVRLVCLLLCLVLPASALAERAYLIHDSNTRAITREELWEWDLESLGYVLNEIFARHGYNFIPGQKYDYYFNCMPWYTPNDNPNNSQACYPKLSSVEWRNENLVKQVMNEMRAMGTTNPGGRSVWDGFSPGFSTLQGFDYVKLRANQTLPVYSAPSSQSWRGASGKACISTNGNVFAAGWESGWLLVMYETNKGSVRVGYVPATSIKGSVNMNRQLNFDYVTATVTKKAQLTDDPARAYAPICTLKKNTQVTYLSTFFNHSAWAYVETRVDGQTVRGFIPASSLSVADAPEDYK